MLHIPSGVEHQAEALEDTFELDIFSPIRRDWISEGTRNWVIRLVHPAIPVVGPAARIHVELLPGRLTFHLMYRHCDLADWIDSRTLQIDVADQEPSEVGDAGDAALHAKRRVERDGAQNCDEVASP